MARAIHVQIAGETYRGLALDLDEAKRVRDHLDDLISEIEANLPEPKSEAEAAPVGTFLQHQEGWTIAKMAPDTWRTTRGVLWLDAYVQDQWADFSPYEPED